MERRIVSYTDGVARVEELKVFFVSKVEVEEQKAKLIERRANAEIELKEVERLMAQLADAEAIIAEAEAKFVISEPAIKYCPDVQDVDDEPEQVEQTKQKQPFQSF